MVKRYNPIQYESGDHLGVGMVEFLDGDWVFFESYKAILTEYHILAKEYDDLLDRFQEAMQER